MSRNQITTDRQDKTSNDPTHIYLNMNLSVGTQTKQYPNAIARFAENRLSALIDDPSKYYCSIIRASFPTADIPYYIMPIATGQSNINLTTLVVSVSSGSTICSAIVKWIPEDRNASIPNDPTLFQDVSSPYYFGSSYTHFANLINLAFVEATDALNLTVSGNVLPPLLQYHPSNQTFSFLAERANFTGGGICKLYFNEALVKQLPNFPAFVQSQSTINSSEMRVLIAPDNSNAVIVSPITGTPITVPNYIRMTQEFPELPVPALQTLVITTSVPIRSENTSKSAPFGSVITNTGSNNSVSNILTDFCPASSIGYEAIQGNLVYTPESEYRLTEMTSTTPLTQFDLQVYWTDTYGNMYPLRIPAGSGMNIKVLFRLKSF